MPWKQTRVIHINKPRSICIYLYSITPSKCPSHPSPEQRPLWCHSPAHCPHALTCTLLPMAPLTLTLSPTHPHTAFLSLLLPSLAIQSNTLIFFFSVFALFSNSHPFTYSLAYKLLTLNKEWHFYSYKWELSFIAFKLYCIGLFIFIFVL